MENETTATPEVATTAEGPSRPRASGKSAAKKKPRTRAKKPAAKRAVPKLVVFFRHGIAEDSSEEKADGERSLTTSGHARTKRSAKGLARMVDKVDSICSSPLLRALQTALWVTKAFGGRVKVRTTDALLPEATPEEMLTVVHETEGRAIVLVGHEPSLTRCMAQLLGVPELRANLRRAGCAAILVGEDGRGTLEWMLAPRTLRGI